MTTQTAPARPLPLDLSPAAVVDRALAAGWPLQGLTVDIPLVGDHVATCRDATNRHDTRTVPLARIPMNRHRTSHRCMWGQVPGDPYATPLAEVATLCTAAGDLQQLHTLLTRGGPTSPSEASKAFRWLLTEQQDLHTLTDSPARRFLTALPHQLLSQLIGQPGPTPPSRFTPGTSLVVATQQVANDAGLAKRLLSATAADIITDPYHNAWIVAAVPMARQEYLGHQTTLHPAVAVGHLDPDDPFTVARTAAHIYVQHLQTPLADCVTAARTIT